MLIGAIVWIADIAAREIATGLRAASVALSIWDDSGRNVQIGHGDPDLPHHLPAGPHDPRSGSLAAVAEPTVLGPADDHAVAAWLAAPRLSSAAAKGELRPAPSMATAPGAVENAMKEPPTSWTDLWNPANRGRVTMFDYDLRMMAIALTILLNGALSRAATSSHLVLPGVAISAR